MSRVEIIDGNEKKKKKKKGSCKIVFITSV